MMVTISRTGTALIGIAAKIRILEIWIGVDGNGQYIWALEKMSCVLLPAL
jgi:hypothetical protein